jgi:hypothetical protein
MKAIRSSKKSKPQKERTKCDASSPFCSQQGVNKYGVNGSEKEGKTFNLCLACMAVLRMRGAKIKQV